MRKRKGTQLELFILTGKSKYFNYLPTPKIADLNYLLFAVYLVVLCWLMLRVPFIKNAGISPRLLLGLFLVKMLAGVAIGWIAIHIYGPGNDYWDTNDYAREEYQLLFTDPAKYFSNLFTSDYAGGYGGLFNSFDSYWNDLRSNIIVKLISVFNILSRGDYYINSLFFNFLVFFGHILLYRVFIKLYPERQWPVIIGCFLLPSTLYFSSGIHKDGIVFLLLAMLIYSVCQSLVKNRFNARRLAIIIICLLMLFFIRSFIFLALLPALFSWVLVAKTKWPAARTFGAVYLVTGLLFFNISSISGKIKPMEIIIKKQTEYLRLTGAETQIRLTPLQPAFKSFAVNSPEALNHSLLRPYLWEVPVRSMLPLCIELFLYQLLLPAFILCRRRETNYANRPFICFAIFFTLSVFLVIGYIVPNLGSLVRYRSLYLPLLITPVLCSLDWKKLSGPFKIKK